jgi:cytochrome b561
MKDVKDMNDVTQGSITAPQWHAVTRVLHGLMAVGIIGQLLFSQFMIGPDHLDRATALEKFSLEGHEVLGLVVVGVMLAHWLWMLFPRSDVSLAKLFPWTPAGLKAVGADVAYLIKQRQLPEAANSSGLSGFIHGLGFLAASVMAASGFALYLVMDWGDGAGSDTFETYAGIHGLFANLMWVYLIGHVAAAAWHEYHGQRLIARMFRL